MAKANSKSATMTAQEYGCDRRRTGYVARKAGQELDADRKTRPLRLPWQMKRG